MADYTICKVEWYLNVEGHDETEDEVIKRFQVTYQFLRDNGLYKDSYKFPGKINSSFDIHTSHLTEKGMAIMDKPYDRWLDSLTKGKNVEDIKILEDALKKLG